LPYPIPLSPVVTFFWTISDIDGDSTISTYEWALDDTTSGWNTYPGDNPPFLTLRESDGLTPGDHAFYIRAVDQAGARSETIRMPENESNFFFVKQPVGEAILIDDFLRSEADVFYRAVMDTMFGDYSYWNIRENLPPSNIPFTETLKLFKYIIWYADLTPHLAEAQSAIPELRKFSNDPSYIARKIFFTMQFNTGFEAGQGNPLEFSPIADLGTFFNRISLNKVFYSDSSDSFTASLNLPQLKVSKTEFGVFSLVPKDNAHVLYRYDTGQGETDPVMAVLGENDNTGENDFVFIGFPVQSLNGNGKAPVFISRIFRNVFGLQR